MTAVDVLVLHGSPGAGKSTLARAISEILRAFGTPHGVIDLDELGLVDPSPGHSFAVANLRAIWPNYAAVPDVKMIVSTVVADEPELRELREAMPDAAITVCELTAPIEVLKDRVTLREPDEFWRSRLRGYVDLHHGRTDLEQIRDILVSTHDTPVDATARGILEAIGWASPASAGTASDS